MESLKLYMKNSSITHYYVVRNFICHELKRPWPQLFSIKSLLHIKKKKTAGLFVVLTAEQHFLSDISFYFCWFGRIKSIFQFFQLKLWPKVNDHKNLVKWLLALNCLLALKVGRTIGWKNFLTSILVINRIRLYEILFLSLWRWKHE